ncbi:hypothetical protein AWM75_04720 [Aerococcus urinaehominis]|uniref:Uncharacterized protein n=1 Tax=Aerococcus urinaehominis TaxID=128944 RepID=A0A0X8FL74_9LACT|nr:D-2-hydroxyacid dehydrogenase [Aerococcus urinaehominis]AMB99344.1 hypothetical protein AWM75_04720 [Aerococcus urinaehominis]SDM58377.1 glycerate dehydrogenase [Aerococcus urinaehominis]
MKAVILDGFPANPGDLDWQVVADQVDQLTIYDRTPVDQVVSRIADHDIVIVNKVVISADIIAACPNIKLIVVSATGYNNIDLEAAKCAGIKVANVPAYSTTTVAQHVFAFILALTNQVANFNQSVQRGDWVASPDFCYGHKGAITELAGLTLGLVGYGDIAQAVARIATAFGMRVIYWNHRPKVVAGVPGVQVEWLDLVSQADIVSLHVPLTNQTNQMINQEIFSVMKQTAWLINTARGPLVNQEDLSMALKNKQIAGAGIDVIDQEPMPADHPLLGLDQVLITPHVAWASKQARQRLIQVVADNIASFKLGQDLNRLEP